MAPTTARHHWVVYDIDSPWTAAVPAIKAEGLIYEPVTDHFRKATHGP